MVNQRFPPVSPLEIEEPPKRKLPMGGVPQPGDFPELEAPKEAPPAALPPIELPTTEPPLLTESFEPISSPETPEDIFTLMETALPGMTAFVGMAREEAVPIALANLEEVTQNRPEDFVRGLRNVGRTPEGEALLRFIAEGAVHPDGRPFTPEDIEQFINEVFGEEEEPFIEPPPPPVDTVVVTLDNVKQLVIRTEDNSLYDRNGNWVGYYDFLTQDVFNPYRAEGLGEKALRSFTAGIGDVLSVSGGASRWLGYNDIGEKLSTVGTQLQRHGVPSSSFEVFDLLNPEFYATKITRTIPFALSLAPLAIGGFYGGVALATTLGMGTIWTMIVGGLTGAALSRPAESLMEAGSQYDDAIARGKTEQEASNEAAQVFRDNLTLVGADAFEIAIALAPTPKWVPVSLVKSGLGRTARIGGKMVIVGLSEGGEEIYQDLIQRRARGEELKLDAISKEVFAIGFVMGGGMGLGGDIVSGIVDSSKNKMSATMRKEYDNLVSGFRDDGFNQSESELKALDTIAQTPEGLGIVQEAVNEAKPEVVTEALPAVPEVEVTARNYPIAGDVVDGRSVKLPLPNQESIEASLEEFEVLSDIRAVPMSAFPEAIPVTKRTELANEIDESGEIVPLIVVIDDKGAYILEGASRFDALLSLNAQSFPAQVVIDRRLVPEVEAKPPTPEVLTQQIWDTMPVSDKSLLAKQAGLASEVGSKTWGDLTSQEQDAIRLAREEIAPTISKPPAVEEAKPIEAPEIPKVKPVEGVAIPATKLDDAVPPTVIEETVPPVADETVNVHDINIIDRFRPTRFVFDKMGLFDIWESTFKAETLKAEAQVAFNEELNKHAKAVGKDIARRELLWEFVNNNNQAVFNQLTFEEKQAALWWKRTADDWADRLNIPQEKRIKDYIPHIFDEQARETQELIVDASISMLFSKKITDKVRMPFLEKRLGKELGLVKDPFLAAQAYQNVALKKFYYEPILQKLKLVSEHKDAEGNLTTPEFARNYLKAYSQRMTGEPSSVDREINKFLTDMGNSVRGLPGGETLANFLEQGNPSGMAAYNLTSVLYVMWLGFKPTTAIRNLSQHGLIIAEVDSIQDFGNGIRLRFTAEGKAAVAESLVWRSRRGAFIESIDSSMSAQWTDAVRESALFLFRKADEQNVKDAFLSGYAEAKRLYPDAGRELWIKRGDEVAANTQYLYTKMNSLAISQNGPGKVGAMLTTWAINWLELMNKFVRGRQSKVYQQLVESDPVKFKLKEKNWLTSRKSLLAYMAIVGLAYGLKEQDWNRLKAFEYTGFTSIRTFANLVGGEFPALQLPGAVVDLITGIALKDERTITTAWNELKRAFSILNQVERVASGERDWLSLLFYLEGKNHQVRKLKEDWEKNWEPYEDLSDPLVRAKQFPTLSLSVAQKKWRVETPKIEAQMFVTNRLGTLSSDEARAEVLRLIDKHDIDTDVINGYEKIFGVDTTVELNKSQKRIGNLEKFKIGEEAEYFTVGNFLTELNQTVKTNGRDKVERDGHAFSVFLLGEQDSWQPYDDYDNAEARKLYRQQFPDVEASMYLTGHGNIKSFQNPESAKILLGIMDKYNIPPQAVPAFAENPDKYDELFTQKFELEQKNFELTTQYENFANPEAPNFIEDTGERKLAREKFKADNPNWVADQRRIEAIDNDATPEIIEKWVDRGKVIDEFGASSSEARLWLIDNPGIHQWALGNKLLTDDGSDWDEEVIRLNVELSGLGGGSEQHSVVERKIEAHDDGFTRIDDFVNYYTLPVVGFRQERYLIEHPEFAQEIDTIRGIKVSAEIPPVRYDELLEQKTRTPEEDLELDALKKFVPENQVANYVTFFSLKKPKGVTVWYEDDWFLIEHPEFYQTVYLGIQENQRADFRTVPTRKVFDKYQAYLDLPLGKRRDDYRFANQDLDAWLVLKFDYTPITEKKRREELTPAERLMEGQGEIEKGLRELGEKLKELE